MREGKAFCGEEKTLYCKFHTEGSKRSVPSEVKILRKKRVGANNNETNEYHAENPNFRDDLRKSFDYKIFQKMFKR